MIVIALWHRDIRPVKQTSRTRAVQPCAFDETSYNREPPLVPGRELNGRPLGRRRAVGPLVRRPVFPPSELSSLSRLEGLRARTAERKGKAPTMPLYEHVVLARQDLSAQQVEEISAQLKGVIEQMGGKVTKTEQWGVKSLAYRLRKNRKAHFTFLNVYAPPAVINEIERQERLNEDVLRYLTVRVEEHEQGPSAMMRKADRDREERGGGFRDRDRGDRDRGDRDRGGFRDRGEHRRDRDSRPPREEFGASVAVEATEE